MPARARPVFPELAYLRRFLLVFCAAASAACLRGRLAAADGGTAPPPQPAESLLLQPQGLLRGQAPAPLEAGAVRLAVIGDYGNGSPEEAAVAKLVLGWDPAAVITTGDNSYPDAGGDKLDRFVGAFYGALPGAARGGAPEATRRFWPTPGNHDWRFNGLQAYLDYFRLPGNGRYYDALIAGGRVHLFALDSDTSEPDGTGPASAQARWLLPRLQASKGACLNLVAFHHPPWSSGEHGGAAALRWPFRAWGANAVVSGHDHTYERLEVDGLPYFVTGLGGAHSYAFNQPLPETKVRWNQRHGALLITVGSAVTTYEFWTWAGERVDRLEVARPCPPPAP